MNYSTRWDQTIKKSSESTEKHDDEMYYEIYAYHCEFMNKISEIFRGRYYVFRELRITVELIEFNSKNIRAGETCHSKQLISINRSLHRKNPHELRNSYGHELAHIFTRLLYGDIIYRSHGKEWKAIARGLGVRPECKFSKDTFF